MTVQNICLNSLFRVTVNAKNDDGKYRVECSEGLVDITAEDIVNLTNIGDELEV